MNQLVFIGWVIYDILIVKVVLVLVSYILDFLLSTITSAWDFWWSNITVIITSLPGVSSTMLRFNRIKNCSPSHFQKFDKLDFSTDRFKNFHTSSTWVFSKLVSSEYSLGVQRLFISQCQTLLSNFTSVIMSFLPSRLNQTSHTVLNISGFNWISWQTYLISSN